MSSSSENLGLEREKAMEELIRGRDCADRLRTAMENPSKTDKEDLLKKIVASFTNTLSILRRFDHFEEVSQIPVGSSAPDSRKSDDSGESIRSSLPRNRRGCYKRRKHAHSWSREDSPSPFDDDHSWRKYGQKNILRSKHPRNYYRCTHKYEQKCQATKQVQQMRDDPPVYRTTYYGNHTCRDLHVAPHLFLHSPDRHDNPSLFLSFDQGNDGFTLPVKQESDDLPPPLDESDPTVLDSCTASFGFDDFMDDFSFDFS
ncbi:PREDICTED: probable WRKY transcription factor 70 [Tarenaya hassleriana]|uniref:probable WRKY transcription factor 70 n=1 Tax=Tarenaya hassleriana TaxID=28532 RepID=UPI00053C5916|nr:PREDICTED: probable WRKY transcription factor 70 [Tarenaya hassleriana]